MVQWLRLHTDNAGILGSISGQGTNIPHALHTTEVLKKKQTSKQNPENIKSRGNVFGRYSRYRRASWVWEVMVEGRYPS